MAVNTFKCNCLTPLHFEGLIQFKLSSFCAVYCQKWPQEQFSTLLVSFWPWPLTLWAKDSTVRLCPQMQ